MNLSIRNKVKKVMGEGALSSAALRCFWNMKFEARTQGSKQRDGGGAAHRSGRVWVRRFTGWAQRGGSKLAHFLGGSETLMSKGLGFCLGGGMGSDGLA